MTLLPDRKRLEHMGDLTKFSITDFSLDNATHPKKGLQMMIRLKRKIMSEMMTTYFPSMLLFMITFATTFFKSYFLEAALSVNLTTMLVMTTIFFSKMESLPSTSDTKMIDIWLIFCQLVPFIQVVLITAKEYLRDEKQEESTVEKEKAELPKDTIDSNVGTGEDEPKSRKAWKINPPRASVVATLEMVGKFCKKYFVALSLSQ